MGANADPNENKSKMHVFLREIACLCKCTYSFQFLGAAYQPSDPQRRRPCLPEGFRANLTQLLSELKLRRAKGWCDL